MRIDYKNQTLLSQEEKNAQDVQFAIQEAKLQLASDILETQRQLASAKKDLEDAKTLFPFCSKTIIAAMANVDGYQKGLDALLNLQKELGLE